MDDPVGERTQESSPVTVINNTGSTLAVPSGGLLGEVDFNGTIIGGIVVNAYPTLDFSGATLQDLLWQGSLSANIGSLLTDGVTVQALDGSQGTIELGNATLAITGDTLDALTLRVVGSLAALEGPDPKFTIGVRGTVNVIDPGATLSAIGYQFINNGTIVVSGTNTTNGANAAVVAHANTLANYGEIAVSDGALFQLEASPQNPESPLSNEFENVGQITVSTGATLVVNGAQYANSGTITLADPTSELQLSGSLLTSNLGVIHSAGGILGTGGTLDNTGQTIEIGSPDGFGALTFDGGTLYGGTLVNDGTGWLAGRGTLDSVNWQGPLVIGSDNSVFDTRIELLNVNELQSSPDGGSQDLRFSGWGGEMDIGSGSPSQTIALNNYNITDAAATAAISVDGTLVLGPAATIAVASTISLAASAFAEEMLYNLPADLPIYASSVVNEGLIDDTSQSGCDVYLPESVYNSGMIRVSGSGDALVVSPGSIINTGTIQITDGAALWFYSPTGGVFDVPSVNNTGDIAIDASSTLAMAGTYTEQSFASVPTSGSSVLLTGTLVNIGNTLNVASGGEFGRATLGWPNAADTPIYWQLPSEEQDAPLLVHGGAVIETGATAVLADVTLDGVAWTGPLIVNTPTASVALVDGSTLTDASQTIAVTGSGDILTFDTATLTNTSFQMGAVGGTVTLNVTGSLTFGTGTTLDIAASGSGAGQLLGNIVNQGSIDNQSGDMQVGLPPPDDPGLLYLNPYGPPLIPFEPSQFDNQGTIVATAGAGATFTIEPQATLINEGLFRVDGGERLLIDNQGYYDATSPVAPGFSNTGILAIGNGTIEFAGSLADTGSIAFTPGLVGELIFNSPSLLNSGPILGLDANDRVEFGVFGVTPNSFNVSGATVTSPGTVMVTTSAGTIAFDSVAFAPGAPQGFTTGTDSATGLAYIEVACFAGGTRLATDTGDVAVDLLRVGDRVRALLSNEFEPIAWIGRRLVDCSRHPKPEKVWPVRIARGALSPGCPSRALYLSPDHAVYVQNVLIPVRYLINGRTIEQVKCKTVRYFHVELPRHNVLLAEGLPVESYLDVGDRTHFENHTGPIAIHPDFSSLRWEASGCAPLVVTGPELEFVRVLVAEQMGQCRFKRSRPSGR